jgi:UDP-N-acetylmuramoyl-L-alanyl-D-glutamate--2,6-diaminopimelate ligase
VIIDYAHTPDALIKALEACRKITKGRLFCVFGCGGNRDRGKRFEMGDIAARLADVAVITSDNPRNEDPADIINDIVSGIDSSSSNYVTILSRQEAIEYALGRAEAGDVILLAGKGHETYIIDKDGTHYFSEKDIVMNFINRKEQ